MKGLNLLYLEHPALWERDYDYAGFCWESINQGGKNVFAFRRAAKGETVLAVFNFCDVAQELSLDMPDVSALSYLYGTVPNEKVLPSRDGGFVFWLAPYDARLYLVKKAAKGGKRLMSPEAEGAPR